MRVLMARVGGRVNHLLQEEEKDGKKREGRGKKRGTEVVDLEGDEERKVEELLDRW